MVPRSWSFNAAGRYERANITRMTATATKPLTTVQVLAKLRRKAGKTAPELGTSVSRMRTLEKRGLVRESGRRMSGKRGKPAVEWEIVA